MACSRRAASAKSVQTSFYREARDQNAWLEARRSNSGLRERGFGCLITLSVRNYKT